MRKIKFRGRRSNGIEVTGGIVLKRSHPMIAVTHCLMFPVESGTVAQLIGVDKEGKEIYEGDKVITSSVIHKATFADYADILRGECILIQKEKYQVGDADESVQS